MVPLRTCGTILVPPKFFQDFSWDSSYLSDWNRKSFSALWNAVSWASAKNRSVRHLSLVVLAKKTVLWKQGTMSCSRLYNEYVWKTYGTRVFITVWVPLCRHSEKKNCGLHCEMLWPVVKILPYNSKYSDR